MGSNKVLGIVSQFLFREKIAAAARALDREIRFVKKLSEAETYLDESGAKLVLIDLHLEPENPALIVHTLKQRPDSPHIIGFFSHVDVKREYLAKEAGIDEVYPRSKFFTRLPDILNS